MTGCDTTTVAASAGTGTAEMMANVMQAKADMCATNEALGGGKKKKVHKTKSKKHKQKGKSKKHKQKEKVHKTKSKKHKQILKKHKTQRNKK